MHFKTLRGYVLSVIIGLILAAAVVLVILQWGNTAEFSLYGKNQAYNTALVVLGSLIFGAVLIPLFRVFFRGIRDIRRGRQDEQIERVGTLDKQQRRAAGKGEKTGR
ncbi:MAG: hypothetical protein GVY16_06745 [Planctomycetes bacterium]|jgi:uncharacterized integral membrane protein|nr:hypothetical protein [Planctomycetota bacterium]